jgi:hypothetical protein
MTWAGSHGASAEPQSLLDVGCSGDYSSQETSAMAEILMQK